LYAHGGKQLQFLATKASSAAISFRPGQSDFPNQSVAIVSTLIIDSSVLHTITVISLDDLSSRRRVLLERLCCKWDGNQPFDIRVGLNWRTWATP
jgi:hypothetical protein